MKKSKLEDKTSLQLFIIINGILLKFKKKKFYLKNYFKFYLDEFSLDMLKFDK